jgi:hypothetical protein
MRVAPADPPRMSSCTRASLPVDILGARISHLDRRTGDTHQDPHLAQSCVAGVRGVADCWVRAVISLTTAVTNSYKFGHEHFPPIALPFRRPSGPTPEELAEGVMPFDGWAVNVRCLENVDFDSIPIRKIIGSKIRYSV